MYALKSDSCDKYYIGSTCSSLSNRFSRHKSHYRDYQNGEMNYMSSFDMIEHDDCYIELIEEYPCNSRKELLAREGQLVRQHKDSTVNRHIPGNSKNRKERDARYYRKNKEKCRGATEKYIRNNPEKRKATLKKYYEKNKAKVLEKQRERYRRNRRRILNKGAERIACECGSICRRDQLSRHRKSKKHTDFIANV